MAISLITRSQLRVLAINSTTLSRHASRVNYVDVTLHSNDMREFLFAMQSDGQQLWSLRLCSSGGNANDDSPHLACGLPSLRHLTLVGVSVRWDSCVDLTRLELRGPVQPEMTFSQLHDVLYHSPRLEDIIIYKYLITNIDISPITVHLPHLRKMMLSTDSLTASHLFSELDSVPPTAHVTIFSAPNEPTMSFLPHGIVRLSPFQITPKTVLRFYAGSGLYLLSQDVRAGSYNSSVTCAIRVEQPEERSSEFFSVMLRATVSHFDLSQLTILELVLFSDFSDADAVESFLCSMPLLSTLRVDPMSALITLTALGVCTGHSQPPCPLLTCIQVGKPDYCSWPVVSSDFVGPIVGALRKRATSLGHPLQTLKLIGTHKIGREVIGLLKPYVDELIVPIR